MERRRHRVGLRASAALVERGRVRVRFVLVACVAVAALSVLAFPYALAYDPWGWLTWGRELWALDLDTSAGPSWKPLPVLIAAPLSLAGGAAPWLWLVLVRAGWFASLVAVYRLGARFAGAGAGAIAAALLLLTPTPESRWFRYLAQGNSEPLLVAAVLFAIERQLDGRRMQAFALAVAAALIRPEAWPFLLAFAVYLWWREPRWRWALVLGLASVPVLWFGGDWLGSGSALTGGDRARVIDAGGDRFATVVRGVFELVILPAWLLAAVAVAAALRRGQLQLTLLAAGAAGWIVLTAAMTLQFGFAGSARFMMPAAALVCLLAAVGAVELLRLPQRPPTRAALAAGLVAVALPFAMPRVAALERQERVMRARTDSQADLARLVRQSGAPVLLGCGTIAVDQAASALESKVRLAWELDVHIERVRHRLRGQPGVIVARRSSARNRRLARRANRRGEVVSIASHGRWNAYAVGCLPYQAGARMSRRDG